MLNNPSIITFLIYFVLLNISFYFFAIGFAAYRVFYNTLMRHSKDQFSRENPELVGPQVEMDRIGQEWMRQHSESKWDVHIQREGVNLYGEYYDLGYDRTVFILSGRTDTLRYGYYFAIPYAENGFNVLVADPRAHGNSDGKYITLGFEEGKDALAWAQFLHDELGNRQVLFHGICIGGAAGLLGITDDTCPDYVIGLVSEGMFANFGESMRNHLIERNKNIWPVMSFIDLWLKQATGYSMRRGPIDYIHKMQKPILMLQSKEDPYSTAANAERLYERCGTPDKQLVLFEKGGHSLLRITDTEKYDGAIRAFIQQYFPSGEVVPASPAYDRYPAESPTAEQVVARLADQAFGYGLAAVITAFFPIASVAAMVLGNKARCLANQIQDIAEANHLFGGGKYIAARIMGLVGLFGGLATTVFWLMILIQTVITHILALG